jgi:putative oxidoreductase
MGRDRTTLHPVRPPWPPVGDRRLGRLEVIVMSAPAADSIVPPVSVEVRMPTLDALRKGSTLGLKVAAALAFIAPLATRVVVGWAFYLTGSGKWAHFENTVTFFTELGIPYPQANAAFVSSLELVGGIALILGLFTRLFATGLASTMVVALLTADKARFVESWSSSSEVSPTDISAFVFLLFFAWLVLYGPGALSVDALVKRWLKVGVEPTR